MPMDERDDAISGLADGRTQILCSVDVVSEGTDVPSVSCAILLRPTQSESLYLQQVGRILRPQDGKVATVLDHVGNTVRHGFVDDLREWSLESKKRKRNDDPAPSVRQCPQCFAAFKPQPVCPCCGFKFPVKPKRQLTRREGELKEMRRQDAIERREKRKEQGRARTLPELLALAKKKGYKPGWAYKIFYGRRY
jgi:DNA repair protein RadD